MRLVTFKLFFFAAFAVAKFTNPLMGSEPFSSALENLRRVSIDASKQTETQQLWNTVAKADVDRLTTVLAAMRDVSPLAENWLRAAVDTIAERGLREGDRLPLEELRKFVLDRSHAPRARRTAFEWLTQVDPSAREQLLPNLEDDTSLELRHDAIAHLISEAEEAGNDEVKLSKFRRAFLAARDLAQTKTCVEALTSLNAPQDLERHFGYVGQWMVIGPFDNTDGAGFDQSYPPEQELDFNKQYQGKNDVIGWQSHQSEFQEIDKVGTIDLNQVLVEEKGVAAYLAATFNLPKDQDVQCRYETVSATKLWVNGELLLNKPVYHSGGEFDQYVAPTTLRRGENTILLKVCQNEQTESWTRAWEVRFRITDQLGGGLWPLAAAQPAGSSDQ